MVRPLMSVTLEVTMLVRDVDRSQFLSLLGEHLDALVVAMEVRLSSVVLLRGRDRPAAAPGALRRSS